MHGPPPRALQIPAIDPIGSDTTIGSRDITVTSGLLIYPFKYSWLPIANSTTVDSQPAMNRTGKPWYPLLSIRRLGSFLVLHTTTQPTVLDHPTILTQGLEELLCCKIQIMENLWELPASRMVVGSGLHRLLVLQSQPHCFRSKAIDSESRTSGCSCSACC